MKYGEMKDVITKIDELVNQIHRMQIIDYESLVSIKSIPEDAIPLIKKCVENKIKNLEAEIKKLEE